MIGAVESKKATLPAVESGKRRVEMDEIKRNIAKNIAFLRTSEHMTQAELAERLSYSDKAISKWERAESIPDIYILKKIADMFGVTVDWLIKDNGEHPLTESNRKSRNHKLITLISAASIWVIAIIAFVICWIANKAVADLWLIFVAAVPSTAILLLIFNSIWGKRRRLKNMLIISLLIWSGLALIFLILLRLAGMTSAWMLFLIGIPTEVVVVLSHKIERTGGNKKKENDTDGEETAK